MNKEYNEIEKSQKNIPVFKHRDDEYSSGKSNCLYYQYRDFSSFWKILESDSWWATDARFSNDEEEQRFGEYVVKCLYEKAGRISGSFSYSELYDNYIICFSKEGDTLSQWRGYAAEGGVAMGFYFGSPYLFSIPYKDCSGAHEQFAALGRVGYISPQEDEEDKDAFESRCKELISNRDFFEKDNREYKDEIDRIAPYIKHDGFREENEYRLVFRNTTGVLNKCINYRDDTRSNIKCPYIVVRPGSIATSGKRCGVRVCVHQEEAELVESLREIIAGDESWLQRLLKDCTIICGCHEKEENIPECFCHGCTLRHMRTRQSYDPCMYNRYLEDTTYDFCLHEKENCVVITQGKDQEKVYEKVHEYIRLQWNVNHQENRVRVWCEGHLPVRQIIVGPCPNQKNMVEAIKHYCSHKFWLRDVDIQASKIPFRKSL